MGKAEKLGVVALSGSHDGSDGVLDKTGRELSETKAAAVPSQAMVFERDYRTGSTSTWGDGPHRSMTGMLSREGEPKTEKSATPGMRCFVCNGAFRSSLCTTEFESRTRDTQFVQRHTLDHTESPCGNLARQTAPCSGR